MTKNILLFMLFCFSSVLAEEIRVTLATDSPLRPIYIGKLHAENSSFAPQYLKALEEILTYDFNYNGATKVCSENKPLGIPYVVEWQVEHQTIRATCLHAATGSRKTFSAIPLSGNLSQDRRQIHKLADGIYKALFNKEGIAHSRILFAYQVKNPRSDGKAWTSEIWECDWDGENTRQVTHEHSYCVSPVLLSHSNSFLYVSYKKGQPKIYIASLDKGEGRQLIDLKGNQLLPAISGKRDKLAFICDVAGRTDLFLQSLHPETGEMGKPVQLYSYPRSTQASPTFSPDGSKIAFVSDKDSGLRIYIIPTAVSEKRPNAVMISKQSRENTCPAWSPDGTKLAYSAKTNGIRQIWIYDLRRQEEWQLTSGPGNKENPAWAHDSTHIVFNSTEDNASELYIVNLHQSEAIKISRGPGKKHYPTWGSR